MALVGDITLPSLTASGTGLRGRLFSGSIALPALTASGALDGPIRLPALTLRGTLLSGAVARGNAVLPGLTSNGSVLAGNAMLGAIRLPGLTLESLSVAGNIRLPALTASGTAVSGNKVLGSLVLPGLTARGTLRFDNNAVGSILLPALVAAGFIRSSGVAQGGITLPRMTVAGTALAGNIGTAHITLPMLTVNGRTGTLANSGTASITLPILLVSGQMQQSVSLAGITVTGIALNTRTKAVSTYEGLAPNSLTRFGGVTLMATDSGIVALTSDADAGVDIDAHLLLGKTDFNAAGITRVLTGYVGMRATGALELTLITDDHQENVYTLQPDEISEQHVARVKLGKGVKGTYWQAKIANADGCDFAIDSIELQPAAVGGKV